MNELLGELLTYLRGIWTYRWIGIACAWLVCVVGWTAVYAMPDVFAAQARFYVDASSRLREVVQNLGMEPDVTSRVFLVRQAMMGRPQLEKVARETDLDIRVSTPEEQEELLNTLREDISITTGNRKEAQNLYRISFEHSDRRIAEKVVNALLNGFLDDVLKQKDSDTERTQEFLDDQLSYYRGLLEETERKLQIFKRDHAGFVVGDRGDYFARMQAQESRLAELNSQKRIQVSKRDELRRQLASVNPYASGDETTGSVAHIPGNEISQRIAELERNRRDLLLRVTELHPDVTALDEQIIQLRKLLKRELASRRNDAGSDGAASASNPVYIEIQIALSNSNLAIAGLDSEIEHVSTVLADLKREVDDAPKLESDFVQLTRDYANFQSLYSEVLNQAERERIGRVGEEKDVISFNIIEPPRATLEPVSPNRPLLLGAVLFCGLIAGAGVPLLLWLLKPTIHSAADLQSLLNRQVIGTISIDLGRARAKNAGSMAFFLAAAGSLGLCFIAVIVGQDFLLGVVQGLIRSDI